MRPLSSCAWQREITASSSALMMGPLIQLRSEALRMIGATKSASFRRFHCSAKGDKKQGGGWPPRHRAPTRGAIAGPIAGLIAGLGLTSNSRHDRANEDATRTHQGGTGAQ